MHISRYMCRQVFVGEGAERCGHLREFATEDVVNAIKADPPLLLQVGICKCRERLVELRESRPSQHQLV